MTRKIFILLGFPGSGKGTQGMILSDTLKIPHISTGEIFRKMALGNSEEAKLLNDYMQQGKLIPGELVNTIVLKFISSDECKKGCILDGYPRNIKQAEYLIKHIDSKIIVFFFNIKDDLVIKRIVGRYNCVSCRALYNRYFSNPRVEGVCDQCGSTHFVSRQDDDNETVVLRIAEYRNETLPLIEYYKDKGNFYSIDANMNKEQITEEMLSIAKKV